MTASKRNIGSDLAKVDAYVNTPVDYEEIPDMADRDVAEGEFQASGVPRIGRPPAGERAKQAVSLRLDPETLERFKATGPGWQTRMNDFLGARQEVIDLVDGYEAAVIEMRKLLTMLRSEQLAAKTPNQARSIDSTERQIALTDAAAQAVRKALNDSALKQVTS